MSDARQCALYLLTPPSIPDLSAFAVKLAAALDAGDVAAAQIRLKDVSHDAVRRAVDALAPVAHARGAAVILNDDPALARSAGCDGVHVGQDDAPCGEARRIVGPGAIVGVTCHDSRHLAMEAAEAGADYVAFGAFFPSHTKTPRARATPEILTWWREIMTTPCVAIGGASVETAAALAAAGADFVAVCAGVWSHPHGPAAAVKAFTAALAGAPPHGG